MIESRMVVDGTLKVDGGEYTHAVVTGPAANILTLNGSSALANPTPQLAGNFAVTGVKDVIVGSTNQATLEISAGRVLNNTGGFESLGDVEGTKIYRGEGYLGLDVGSSGTVTVIGAGSQWYS